MVVQAAERTRYVGSLCLLDLVHKFAHIGWNRIHTESVESSFQHMGLDSGLLEWSCPLAYGLVRIFSEKQIYLLEGTSVSLDTVKTSHIDNGRSNLLELVDSRHIFA